MKRLALVVLCSLAPLVPCQEIPGRLVAASESVAAAEAAGRVVEVLARPGDLVEAGQALARLDPTDAQAAVEAAKLELRRAEIEIESGRVRLDTIVREVDAGKADLTRAQAQVDEARELVDQGLITPQQIQEGETALLQMKQRLAEGEYGIEIRRLENDQTLAIVERARIEVTRAERMLEAMTLRARAGGTVLELRALPGQWLAAGETVAWIADAGHVEFEGEAPEGLLPSLEPGRPGVVRVGALEGKEWPAKLVWVAPAATAADGGPATIQVRFAVEAEPGALKPGLTARAVLSP